MRHLRYISTLVALLCVVSTAISNPLDTDQRVSVALEDVSVATAMEAIAAQNGINIVVSGQITGTVSVRLNDVRVKTALDAILTANGYSYVVQGEVIIVKPMDQAVLGELATRTIDLKYLDPVTAAKALESVKSERGKIVILDRLTDETAQDQRYVANRILVTDFPSVVDEMESLIDQLDVAERVISIKVRLIETTVDDETKLGFSWPSSASAKLGNAAPDQSTSSTTTTTTTTTQEQAAGYLDIENDDWRWGTLSVGELQVVLNMLEKDGNSRLVSDPHLTTLENHEAEISIETIIPIATINRFTEAAATQDIVTFQDEEVGISLKVTPRINENGKITLDVYPQVQEIIGFSGPQDNQKPITSSRSIRTRITVEDGETAALGGLLKESDIENITRVPFLGHIPIIGSLLFTNRSTEKSTTDLIILITPKIL